MNPIAVTQIFEATYIDIFKCLLVAESTQKGLFGTVLTYYRIIRIYGQENLYLYSLI